MRWLWHSFRFLSGCRRPFRLRGVYNTKINFLAQNNIQFSIITLLLSNRDAFTLSRSLSFAQRQKNVLINYIKLIFLFSALHIAISTTDAFVPVFKMLQTLFLFALMLCFFLVAFATAQTRENRASEGKKFHFPSNLIIMCILLLSVSPWICNMIAIYMISGYRARRLLLFSVRCFIAKWPAF